MDDELDPLEEGELQASKLEVDEKLRETARILQARQDAFRDIADRFYMLWWGLPASDLRSVDREIQDLFRMFMDLAPSMGVSRNGIPELRECCGRKRTWKDDPISGSENVRVMAPAKDEKLGWCPGDIIRRITRRLGIPYCEKCDQRRQRINAFFRCGK